MRYIHHVSHLRLTRSFFDPALYLFALLVLALCIISPARSQTQSDLNLSGPPHSAPLVPTTTTISSSLNPAPYGQPVVLTIDVSSDAGIPDGEVYVTRMQGMAIIIATVTLESGHAEFSTTLPVGTHQISAAYQGNGTFAGSSASLSQTIVKTDTTTTLSSSLNPSIEGQAVTLTVSVSSVNGPSAGIIVFYDGASILGYGTLSGGTTTLTTSSLGVGVRNLKAVYLAAEGYNSSQATLTQTVQARAITFTALSSSANPSIQGQPVTLTATVTSPSGAPDGGVVFFNGSIVLGSAYLDGSGKGSITVSDLDPGSHQLKVIYPATERFAVSSSSLIQVVKVGTTTVLQSSPNPSVIGRSVTLVAQVSSANGTPQGTVTFYDGPNILVTKALVAGNAAFTTAALGLGRHNLTARFAGNGTFAVSQSSVVPHVIKYGAAVQLSASAARIKPLESVTFVARVVSPTVPPTGSVTFMEGTVPLRTVALSGGAASFTTPSLAYGTHRISAIYNGSASHIAATSPAVAVVVTYAIGIEVKLNIATARDATRPTAADLAGGSAVVAWESQATPTAPLGIVARMIARPGAPHVGEIVIAPVGTGVGSPNVAGLTGGDFVVVWHAGPPGQRNIFARRYASSGVPRAAATRVNVATGRDNGFPRVSGLPDGGFYVAWQSTTIAGIASDIHARRFSNTGVPSVSQIVVNATVAGEQTSPVITRLTNGNSVVAWSGSVAGGFSPFFQLYLPNGTKSGTEKRLLATPVSAPPRIALTALASGQFAVAWHRPESAANTPTDVYLQRITAGGASIGVPLRINTVAAGFQSDPALATIAGNDFVSAWTGVDSTSPASAEGIEAQVFKSNGARNFVPFAANGTTAYHERFPSIAPYNAGVNYLVAWSTSRTGQPGGNVVMQRFSGIAPATGAQSATTSLGNGDAGWQPDM